jgi:hypothetical protein
MHALVQDVVFEKLPLDENNYGFVIKEFAELCKEECLGLG